MVYAAPSVCPTGRRTSPCKHRRELISYPRQTWPTAPFFYGVAIIKMNAKTDAAFLSAEDAMRITKTRGESQNAGQVALVRMVERKIQTVATMGDDDTIWTVPVFQCDISPYKPLDMAEKVEKHLEAQGFYVKRFGTVLYVSWRYRQPTPLTFEYKRRRTTGERSSRAAPQNPGRNRP